MADIAVAAALVLVEKVFSSLGQLLNLQKTVRDDLEEIRTRLRRMRAYLRDKDGNEGSEVLKERVNEIRDLANHIEDVVAEFMYLVPHKFDNHRCSERVHGLALTARLLNPGSRLHDMKDKIATIKRKINDIINLDQLTSSSSTTCLEEGSSQVAPLVSDEEEIVGFEEHREALIEQLTDGESRHRNISVVGPGGSGKTILVKNVYDSKRIWRQFDCRAWVQVSQSCNIEELLLNMLKQFCASRMEPIPNDAVGRTRDKLRYYLQQKSYVLVLDDIWNKEHWESIMRALPNDSSRSRIIVTTRKSDVASCNCVHDLSNGLPWPVAWGLFCKKAFHGKCPPELVEWSQKIVKRCEGLPLAIVAVGSLLSKKQQFPSEWRKVHDSLGSEIGTHSNLSIISKTLLPSYKDLSIDLKNCFLYFSIFPEDYSIKRGRLVRLWIAEGFVQKMRGKTLEEVAEDYLNELIGRNLVHANSWDFDGRPGYCRVLNLVHDFLTHKAEEVNFVSVLAGIDTSSSSKKARRLSIHNDHSITSSQKKDLGFVRSAFFFKRGNVSPSPITDLLRAFKLLGVLDLSDAPLDEFPEAIFHLTLLRYLCLRNTKIKKVPESIKNLPYLETLDLKQTNVTELPKGILQLHNLCHLLVYSYNVKNYVRWDSAQGVKLFEGIGNLTNLQKLSLVKPDKHNKIIGELGALTQLRKLGIIMLKRGVGKDLCKSIQEMENLSTLDVSSTGKEESLDLDDMDPRRPLHLQRLYLQGRLEKFPGWISSLDNVFRIRLQWSRLKISPLEVLGELPNLMELQMVDAFIGDKLEFKAGSFKKLKILHIEQFDGLNTVVVEKGVEGAMPLLQKLTLCNCVNLKLLPLGINNLTHLEELLLYNMPSEFTRRVQRSSEEYEMVSHIHYIRSFVLGANGFWSLDQNLS